MNRIQRSVVFVLLTLLLAPVSAFALDPGDGHTTRRLSRLESVSGEVEHAFERAPLFAVLVTDLDPHSVAGRDRIAIRRSQWIGPFPSHDTPSLFVYALIDRRVAAEGPLDLEFEFLLPDGSSYQKRVVPVSPEAREKTLIHRPDLSPRPVRLAKPARLGVLERVIPSEDLLAITPEITDYVSINLPVSGTWITKHNLYGTWTVVVTMKRGREILAESSQDFDLLP